MDGIAAYRENSVETQSRGRIVVLLYEGAIKFLRQSIQKLEAGEYTEKGRLINRAVDIIDELNVSLDTEAGGEISQNLRALYHFMRRRLNQANIRRDPEMIREVITLLEDLLEAWKQITA